MGTISEDRLASAVAPEALGIGERVLVITQMGHVRVEGEVAQKNFGGVLVKGDGVERVYESSLYRFVLAPKMVEPDDVPNDMLGEAGRLPSDLRAEEKMKSLTASSASQPEQIKGGGGEQGAVSGEGKPEKEGGGQGAAPPGDVDPAMLPPAVQKKVLKVKEMSPEDIDRVLTEVGDAAMRGLRRAGVRESELYALTDKIVQAARGAMNAMPGPLTKRK